MIPFYALRFRNSRNFLSDPAEAFPVLPGSPCVHFRGLSKHTCWYTGSEEIFCR
jgi:hypothetical protein